MDHRGAGRALALRALVALDAAVVAVLGLALFPGQPYPVDAAVAVVEHGEVIDHAAAKARAAGRVRPDPVEVRRHELLVLCQRHAASRGEGQTDSKSNALHRQILLWVFTVPWSNRAA